MITVLALLSVKLLLLDRTKARFEPFSFIFILKIFDKSKKHYYNNNRMKCRKKEGIKMFIEFHDPNPIAINVDNIQGFWYDETFDRACIAMINDYEFKVTESYQEVIDKITKALSYGY